MKALMTLLWAAAFYQTGDSLPTSIALFMSDVQGTSDMLVTYGTVTNWGNTVSREVLQVFPRTLFELTTVVDTARLYNLFVRGAGELHSFSDHFPEQSHVMVKLDQYLLNDRNRLYLTQPNYYRRYTTVTLNPSVTLAELQDFMVDNGVTLPSFPSVDSTYVAGLLASGTHGYNWKDGPISSHLVVVQIVNSDAQLRQYDVDQIGDQFNIFRSHLGICGIIVSMTFRVYPITIVGHFDGITVPINNLFFNTTNLRQFLISSDSFRASWVPFNSLDLGYSNADVAIWDGKNDHVTINLFENINGGTSEITNDMTNNTVINTTYMFSDGYISNTTLSYGYYPNVSAFESTSVTNVQCEFALSVDANNLDPINATLEILFAAIKAVQLSSSSIPVTSIQFGFFSHNASCLLCHSNIADTTINPNSKGNTILAINFVFSVSSTASFNSFISQLYSNWASSNIYVLPHLAKYIPPVTAIQSYLVSSLAGKVATFLSYRSIASVDSVEMLDNRFVDSIVFPSVTRSYDISDIYGGGGAMLGCGWGTLTLSVLVLVLQ